MEVNLSTTFAVHEAKIQRKEIIRMKYVGLTDNPEERRRAHGNPPDWWQRAFSTETEARSWEKEMLAKPGYTGNPGANLS